MATEDLKIRVMADGTIAVQRQIENIGTSAKQASRDMYLLNRTLQGLGIGLLAREFVQLADSLTSINNRLANVTHSSAELRAVTEELFNVSNRTRTSFEDNANLFNRMALATRELGLSQSELLRITETMNQAIVVSGVRSQEASNALIQLSQGMSSGRLNGDELRSVLEQLPPVADILAKQLGVTRGELRKLGADGKITTDVIIEAFQAAESEISERFAKMAPTIGQSLVVLRNNLLEFIGDMDKATGFTGLLAGGIMWVSNNMDILAKAVMALAIVLGPAMLTGALSIATSAVLRFTVALMTNPLIAAASAIAALVALVVIYGKEMEIAADSMTTLWDVGVAIWESMLIGGQMFTDWATNEFGPSVGWITSAVEGAFQDIQSFMYSTAKEFDAVIGLVVATFDGVVAVWSSMPDVFREVGVNIGNALGGALTKVANEILRFVVLLPERMLTAIADGINMAVKAFQDFVAWLNNLPAAFAQIWENVMAAGRVKIQEGINWIMEQFNKVGANFEILPVEAANDIFQVGIENADALGESLSTLADNYKTLQEGGDVLEFTPMENEWAGSAERAGQVFADTFNATLNETHPGRDWVDGIMGRAGELQQQRADADRIKRADDENNAGVLNIPGTRDPRLGQGATDEKEAAKRLKAIKKVKDDLATLEMSLDNQVFADAGRVREIENTQAEQLAVIKQALEMRILTEQQAADRVVAIRDTAARKIRDIEFARYSEQLTAASSVFDSLSSIAKDFAGEQSGVYKAMFIASKAFAIADSIIKIQQGIANALSLPFPTNLGAVAAVAAQAASIVSNIQAVSLALADGGYVSGPGTGRSDSIPAMLSNGEFVVNAQATRQNRQLLEGINSGAAPSMSMAAMGGGVSGGGIKVQVIDQRSNGAPVQIEHGRDANGEEFIRAIVRDESASLYQASSRQRKQETLGAVREGRKRGAL